MNLIEQLGGYEKSKLIIDNQINSEFQTEFFDINGNYYANDFGDLVIYINNQWVDFDSKDPEFELFSITDLEAEVIQYRRQHKIYEAGDWVCPLIRIVDEIEGVGCFTCADKGELVVARDVRSKGSYCSHEHRLDNSFYMAFNEFRHATDAEIEAGKRLEVV